MNPTSAGRNPRRRISGLADFSLAAYANVLKDTRNE